MVVKSGTRRMTFKLEKQKQTLLELFRAASPRLFRQLVAQEPTLRSTNSGNNMTILQRNIEHALWLGQQKDFTEGEAADVKELAVRAHTQANNTHAHTQASTHTHTQANTRTHIGAQIEAFNIHSCQYLVRW